MNKDFPVKLARNSDKYTLLSTKTLQRRLLSQYTIWLELPIAKRCVLTREDMLGAWVDRNTVRQIFKEV